MKTFFNWLLVAVCLFTVGNVQVMASNEEKEVKVSVPISTGDVLTGDDQRGVLSVPFTVYYQNGTIYISTFAEFSMITINVENETTGQVWNSASDILDGMGDISIINGGAGSYSVEIVTEYEEIFYGTFTLD
ncbi:MAG: DUF3244 domain-containing protein [Bacteroidaceae bacterium]|nr:DUF3244 domain-containing protein [Bacteroidaceae bacterium]